MIASNVTGIIGVGAGVAVAAGATIGVGVGTEVGVGGVKVWISGKVGVDVGVGVGVGGAGVAVAVGAGGTGVGVAVGIGVGVGVGVGGTGVGVAAGLAVGVGGTGVGVASATTPELMLGVAVGAGSALLQAARTRQLPRIIEIDLRGLNIPTLHSLAMVISYHSQIYRAIAHSICDHDFGLVYFGLVYVYGSCPGHEFTCRLYQTHCKVHLTLIQQPK